MPKPILLTVPEACRELGGLSRAAAYRLLKAGEIEAVHIGRLIKIPSTSIEAYVARLAAAERPNAAEQVSAQEPAA